MIKYKLHNSLICLYISLVILTACGHSFSDNTRFNNENSFSGTLRVHSHNPRYLTDDSGKAIYLTGSHTWNNLQDMGSMDPPIAFDYNGYLDFLSQRGHNFTKMWVWELAKYHTSFWGDRYTEPFPWQRTGDTIALDGKPKFDLTKFNQSYFDRLRSRVIAARDKGIYVSLMLFEGWGIYYSDAPWHWDGHPFNVNNNINGIDGDPNKDGKGLESHTLQIPSIGELQEEYVKKVIDTVNDLDNVLYEISNEDHDGSIEWQYHMINFIHNYEKTMAKQHPVGMTTHVGLGNDVVFNSGAEWISTAVSKWGDSNDSYKVNPPATDGRKVIILDTDHLWGGGKGADRVWVWKSFLRGYNPIYMDNLDSNITSEEIRRAMGQTLVYTNKINLSNVFPHEDLTSTTYCLANPGSEYLIYLPQSNTSFSLNPRNLFKYLFEYFLSYNKSFTVNLIEGRYCYEWFNPSVEDIVSTGTFTAEDGNRSFTSPFDGDAVLYIYEEKEH